MGFWISRWCQHFDLKILKWLFQQNQKQQQLIFALFCKEQQLIFALFFTKLAALNAVHALRAPSCTAETDFVPYMVFLVINLNIPALASWGPAWRQVLPVCSNSMIHPDSRFVCKVMWLYLNYSVGTFRHKAYTRPPRKSVHWKKRHRTKTSQFKKWVDPNIIIIFLFNQVYPYIPFHVVLQDNSI
jgi:hypothetical protein